MGKFLPLHKVKYLFKVFELARQMANEISSVITYDNARNEDAYRTVENAKKKFNGMKILWAAN